MNDEFVQAYMAMDVHQDNLFLTGKAGTGKSTLLRYFVENTHKRVAVIAPTGIAALNVKGQTVHRFCEFGVDVSLAAVAEGRYRPRTRRQQELLQNLDCIVVDEVSMLRADLLDCLQGYLSLYGPHASMLFGGVQMIFVGDLYQLPPVLLGKEEQMFKIFYDTPYFFSANCMKGLDYKHIELQKAYRQEDQDFINLLNTVRDGTAGSEQLNKLNTLIVNDDFDESKVGVVLTTTNAKAKERNEEGLAKLDGKLYSHEAEIKGKFTKEYYPTDPDLVWKDGARVMFLNNDTGGRWVNGTMGMIKGTFDENNYIEVRVELDKPTPNGSSTVTAGAHTWELFSPVLKKKKVRNDENKVVEKEEITLEPTGTFKQLPFKLAWAVTIHKSQGQTFDDLLLDTGKGIFADGQLYTALSRCRTFEGLHLYKHVMPKDVRADENVRKFMKERAKVAYIENLQKEIEGKVEELIVVADTERITELYMEVISTEYRRWRENGGTLRDVENKVYQRCTEIPSDRIFNELLQESFLSLYNTIEKETAKWLRRHNINPQEVDRKRTTAKKEDLVFYNTPLDIGNETSKTVGNLLSIIMAFIIFLIAANPVGGVVAAILGGVAALAGRKKLTKMLRRKIHDYKFSAFTVQIFLSEDDLRKKLEEGSEELKINLREKLKEANQECLPQLLGHAEKIIEESLSQARHP